VDFGFTEFSEVHQEKSFEESLTGAMHDSRYPVTFVSDAAMGSVGWCPEIVG